MIPQHRSLYPIVKPRETCHLKVSEKHTLFCALYGNPKGTPVVLLHGGPGAGCKDEMTQFFDLNFWNVVMFDQRGAMRSTPFCCMEENSPQHSVEDIETIRKSLGIEKWLIFGGSWGSTLAMLYGQEYPEYCLGFILRGIFLGRKQDVSHIFHGMGEMFPEAYEPFFKHIPEPERNDLFNAYYRRIFDPDPGIHMHAARTIIRYDMICSTQLPKPDYVEKVMQNDQLVLSMSRAFFHYAKHDFFIEPEQIWLHMHKIAHLPAVIIHGRWDAINLPKQAYLLHKSWSKSKLWIIPDGGHSPEDQSIATALAEATDLFKKI